MPIPFVCPSCKRMGCVSEDLAGRRVRCPRCSHTIQIPLSGQTDKVETGWTFESSSRPLTLAARLGLAALTLGLLAVLLMCLPLIGYVSVAVSGGGLVLGLWGLARSIDEDAGEVRKLFGSKAARSAAPSRMAVSFPLVGVAVCLLALALALLPLLWAE
jgi:hypothetical protein